MLITDNKFLICEFGKGQHLPFPVTVSNTIMTQLVLLRSLQLFSSVLPKQYFQFHFQLLVFLLSLFLLCS